MSRAKYASRNKTPVYPPFLERLHSEESGKFKKEKDAAKAVRAKLHQAYGAYYSEKNLESARSIIEGGGDLPELSKRLANLSLSSGERAGFADEFYRFIFGALPPGDISTVLDVGCGFGPFFLPCMAATDPKVKIAAYHAVDIGVGVIELVNRYFALAGLPQYARCLDLMAEIPDVEVDLAFLFKIVPTLETRKRGRGFEVLHGLDFRYAAVSFPTRTLGGKNINMAGHYADLFEKNMDRDRFSILGKQLFKNELVYVLAKNPAQPGQLSQELSPSCPASSMISIS